jgi:hypothetical protein
MITRQKGDKVVINFNLLANQEKGILPEMIHHRGKPVTISKVTPFYYLIKEDSGMYGWTDEMFE